MAEVTNTQKIEYFGKTDLVYLVNLIHTELQKYVLAVSGKGLSENDFTTELKNKLDGIDVGATKTIIDSVLDALSENPVQNKVVKQALDLKAPITNPTFTGNVTVPTASEGTNSTIAASTAFVVKAIQNALADIVGIKFDGPYDTYDAMVTAVTNPRQGTIYLVTNSGSVPNANDEYFWNGTSFELFGTTALDLSGYLKTADISEMTESEVKAAWDSVFNS